MLRPFLEWTATGALLGTGLAFGDQFNWLGLWVGIPLGGIVGAIIGLSVGFFKKRHRP
jgi:ABC-type branched-subunit amino acid transport system permease subunit